ncbi:HD domain-containing phosphohydrolase [Candidatus Latescibacterota bacterium]
MDKILFVDDEPKILSGFERQLHSQYDFKGASSGKIGLEIIEKNGPFAVVISDMRMPKMDGIQFLKRVKEVSPYSVRMMLTGNADLQTAIDAINENNIFRFLMKPCPPMALVNSLDDGIKQYHLIMSEKILLEKTLLGSIKVLTEILSLVNPDAFSQTNRIKPFVKHIVKELHLPNAWQFELAAMLSQIGCVAIPPDILNMVYSGKELSEEERKVYSSYLTVGSKLIANIPRLELVSEMIEGQQKTFKVQMINRNFPKKYLIDMGSQILRVVVDLDILMIKGHEFRSALIELNNQKNIYNIDVLKTLESYRFNKIEKDNLIKVVYVNDIMTGVIAYDNIVTETGILLVPKGQEITFAVIAKLKNFAQGVGVHEPFRVQLIT